jgi:hypothetical protein
MAGYRTKFLVIVRDTMLFIIEDLQRIGAERRFETPENGQ